MTTELSQNCPRCAHPVPGRRCEQCGVTLLAGSYVVQKVLSEAGQSRTYLARSATGELVFLKELIFLLVPDAKALEAFEREGELLKQLHHPNIPGYLAHFSEGEGKELRLYLAERYIEGPSLLEELEKRRYSEEEVRQVAGQLLAILGYLHRRIPPILHRDLKPANVIRRADGQLALVDFGSARDAAVRGAQGATQSGTVGYAPPEQLAGVVSPGSDVYALAATLLHLLTRKAPWEQLEAGFEPTIRGLGVSSSLAHWLTRALDPRADKRFGSAAEAATELAARGSGLGRRLAQVAGGLAALAVVAGAALGGRQLLLLSRTPPVHPDLIDELCPEGGFLVGDPAKEQFCQTRVGDKAVRNGPAVKYQVSGTAGRIVHEVAHYKNDVLDGAFIEYGWEASIVQAGTYVNGVRQGPWKTNQGEGEMVDGKQDGSWTHYWGPGRPQEVATYVMGQKNGLATTYDSQDRKDTETTWKNDRPDGTKTKFFPDGKIQSVTTYVGGVSEGPFVEYTAAGRKKQTGENTRGSRDGTWTDYFPDETPSTITHYQDHNQVDLTEFFPGGAKKAVWTADPRSRQVSAVEYFEDGTKHLELGPCEDQADSRLKICRTEYYKGGKVASKCGLGSSLSMSSRERQQREGLCREWHENGALRSEGEYDFGERRRGTWKTFWPNTKLRRVELYDERSQQDGEFKQYFETGRLQLSGSWVKGQKKGLWIELGPNGELISKRDLGK